MNKLEKELNISIAKMLGVQNIKVFQTYIKGYHGFFGGDEELNFTFSWSGMKQLADIANLRGYTFELKTEEDVCEAKFYKEGVLVSQERDEEAPIATAKAFLKLNITL